MASNARVLRSRTFGALAALAVPALAHAQAIDLSHGGPITVTAVGGIDWDQNAKTVTAHGDARSVRGNATITSDIQIAHYRPKTKDASGKLLPPPPPKDPNATGSNSGSDSGSNSGGDTGGNEIYRLNAEGNVHIFTQTDQGWGDHLVYDIDSAVMVLTGAHLRMTTPTSVLTARDQIEYYPQTHMAVARGDAVVVTNDAKRIRADVLVAYMVNDSAAKPGDAAPAPAAAAVKNDGKKSTDDAQDAINGGKVERVEAYGHVVVRTITDTVTGDRGLYLPPTGISRVFGHVHITRGANQLNGAVAIINMKTGIATLTQIPGQRVQGVIVPNSPQPQTPQSPQKSGDKAKPAGGASAAPAATTPAATTLAATTLAKP